MPNKFMTFLDHIGHDINVAIEDVLKFTTKYQGLIDVGLELVPGAGPAAVAVFNSTVAAVTLTEQKFAAVGQSSGTGAQKLATVTQIVGQFVGQYLGTTDKNKIQGYINSIVALLNSWPSPTITLPAPVAVPTV